MVCAGAEQPDVGDARRHPAALTQSASMLWPRGATTNTTARRSRTKQWSPSARAQHGRAVEASGSAKAGRSSMMTTSKSSSRAWRAIRRETWPPPATTSCGRLVTGSTSSSLPVVEGDDLRGAVPHLLERCVAGASSRSSIRACRACGLRRAPAPALETKGAAVAPKAGRRRPAGRRRRFRSYAERADAIDRRRPRRSATPSARIPWCRRRPRRCPRPFLGQPVLNAQRRRPASRTSGGVDASASTQPPPQGAERPLGFAGGQDQLGSDHLRGAALVRTTVATAKGTPAAVSSWMRWYGEAMVSGIGPAR